MGKGRLSHATPRSMFRQRFDDLDDQPPHDGASFFFDLKLMLPDGMTAHDMHRARQAVEHRLQRTVRKKDRIVWTADGFFLLIATTHAARAGAAAERIHEDLCALLAGRAAAQGRREPLLSESKPRPTVRGNHDTPHTSPRLPPA